MSQTSKIVLTVVITAIVSGGGVYLWQTQNSTTLTPIQQEQENEISNSTAEPKTISEKKITLQDELSLEGKIHYRIDGSAWLETADGNKYDIQIQDTTVVKNIPENLLDERIKKLMKEAGKSYPWFGLMDSISTYIKENTTVKIQGTTNIIIADEIQL